MRGSQLEHIGAAPDFVRVAAGEIEERVLDAVCMHAGNEQAWVWAEASARDLAQRQLAAVEERRAGIRAQYEALNERQRVLEDKVEALAGTPGSARAIASLSAKLTDCDNEAATLDQLLVDLNRIAEWYGLLAQRVVELRGHFLDVVRHRRRGRSRALKQALQRVLERPYGVVLYNGGRVELNLYLGEHFHEAADELVKLEVNHARQDSNL